MSVFVLFQVLLGYLYLSVLSSRISSLISFIHNFQRIIFSLLCISVTPPTTYYIQQQLSSSLLTLRILAFPSVFSLEPFNLNPTHYYYFFFHGITLSLFCMSVISPTPISHRNIYLPLNQLSIGGKKRRRGGGWNKEERKDIY